MSPTASSDDVENHPERIPGYSYGTSDATRSPLTIDVVAVPAGQLIPVGGGRKRLREHRSGDDDVDGGDVGSDGQVAPSAGEDVSDLSPDVGSQPSNRRVVDGGAAVEGEGEIVAGGNCLFEELCECRDGRLVAESGSAGVREHEFEGAR